MSKEYILELMKQYAAAQGYTNPDFNNASFIREFEQWLISMRNYGQSYLTFIEFMSTKPEMKAFSTAEVNKGPLDSIVLDTNYEMITHYFSGDVQNNFCVVTPGEFSVYMGEPVLIQNRRIKSLSKNGPERFITQNPYSKELLVGWDRMHNNGTSNITVGVFGSIYDKDIRQKEKMFKDFVEKLNDGFKCDKFEQGDIYGLAVASNRKIRERVREK